MVTAEQLDRSVWARARWLVLSPHPDDETLGAGALIGHAAGAGLLAGVVYLTDGTGSHPEGTRGLAAARRSEARAALHRLAGRPVGTDWLGWKDAHPVDPASLDFRNEARRLGAMLRRRRIDAIAVTDLEEDHCDHVAAFRLAAAAARCSRRRVALFAYRVWSGSSWPDGRRVRTRSLPTGRRRRALQAHRSQMSNSHGEGFRIPPDKRRMEPADTLALRNPGA